MAQAGSASWDGSTALNRWVSVGATVVSVVYAALVMAWASTCFRSTRWTIPTSTWRWPGNITRAAHSRWSQRGVQSVVVDPVTWLLAVFDRIGLLLWAPLLINIACFVASVRIALAFAFTAHGAGWGECCGCAGRDWAWAAGVQPVRRDVHGDGAQPACAAEPCCGHAGDQQGKYDGLALGALVVGPLVRFEGAVVLALGVGAALVDRKWMFAALAVVLAGMVGLPRCGWRALGCRFCRVRC